MAELIFGIAAYATSGPSPDQADIRWPTPVDAPARPPVPMLLRRRVTPIGQAALRAAWAMPDLEHARFVFASRNGEFDRSFAMLTCLATGEGPSPADFSLGVHNALAGLLSIAARNGAGHTALAAGIDSFGYGLMESAACLLERPEQPVLLIYFDPDLPPGYPDTTPVQADAAGALALLMVPAAHADRRIAMTVTPRDKAEPGRAAVAVFLRFLQTTAPDASAAGERHLWAWRHV